jgi:EpsD family peptidyl-prolyl cis-trans isomerase
MNFMRRLRYSSKGWRLAGTAVAVCSALALAACGKKQDGETAKAMGQVIAHVGPDDITQPELDNEMRLANVPPDKRKDDAVVRAALSRVIERKYIDEQAMAAKLDREPTVLLDLLRSREQVLAGAYVQRELGAKVSGISNSEVDAYIQAHPDKFAKRRIYNIEQVSFTPQGNMEDLAGAVKSFNSLDQVTAKLNDLGLKYSRGPGALDSATLPNEMLKPLDARKPEDIFFVRGRGTGSFFKVTSVEDKPLTSDQSNGLARRELRNDIAKKIGKDTLDAALASAKYEGDLGKIMTAPSSPAPSATEPNAAEPPAPGEPAAVDKEGATDNKDAPKN